MEQHFHFYLGPVQSFIAQARRTRDFWAGSFIISWLAAVAMKEVKVQGGKVVFPMVDNEFIEALDAKSHIVPKNPDLPKVPTRFRATFKKDFDPEKIEKSVYKAWEALAKIIYDSDLSHLNEATTKTVWERQINAFWQISWAVTDDVSNTFILDKCKRINTYSPPSEAGTKCMMMADWQELSGKNAPDIEPINEFWGKLRSSGKAGIKTDIREQEYLCTIGFIKRRFNRYFHTLLDVDMGDWKLKGWKVSEGIPAVDYLAASSWLANIIEQASDKNEEIQKDLWNFHDKSIKLYKESSSGQYPEYNSKVQCIDKALERINKSDKWRWKALDGSVFFPEALNNRNIFPVETNDDENLIKDVLKSLEQLKRHSPLGNAPKFYAVLRMDGGVCQYSCRI